jgi:hypothetical protein
MTRDRINRISGGVAVVMSLLALAIVLGVVTTGWERHLKDEGIAAHLFQLLIAGQIPFLAAFLATIDRAHLKRVMRLGVLEAGSLALAFGCVAYFRL